MISEGLRKQMQSLGGRAYWVIDSEFDNSATVFHTKKDIAEHLKKRGDGSIEKELRRLPNCGTLTTGVLMAWLEGWDSELPEQWEINARFIIGNEYLGNNWWLTNPDCIAGWISDER